MPIPLIAGLVGAAIGKATNKKKKAVSGYTRKKTGTKVKAYLKNAR
jgi:hypothetical protein